MDGMGIGMLSLECLMTSWVNEKGTTFVMVNVANIGRY